MTTIELDTAVFNDVYLPYLNSDARIQIYYGGASSGKSVFLAQRAIYHVLYGGRNYLICRAVARTIRKSVYVEITKHIREWGLTHLFTFNKTELTITCNNGYQMLFAGLDDVEKLKSITPQKGVLTNVWIEEATETHYSSIQQLFKRQRGESKHPKTLTMSFNPIIQSHWIYKEYFAPHGWADDDKGLAASGLTIFKTTYKDNQFLTDGDINDLENEQDKYMYNVYTLGMWGVLGNVIFKNYEVRDLSEIKHTFDRLRHGVDWGFGADPFAFNSTFYDKARQTLYIFDEYHAHEISDEQSARAIRPFVQYRSVVCDSAEPKAIAKYNELGINAIGARKGRGSIETGYRWLKSIKIIIDKDCPRTIQEFQLHSWKTDKYGDPVPVPEDKNNHHIDEVRYQCEDVMVSEEAGATTYA